MSEEYKRRQNDVVASGTVVPMVNRSYSALVLASETEGDKRKQEPLPTVPLKRDTLMKSVFRSHIVPLEYDVINLALGDYAH